MTHIIELYHTIHQYILKSNKEHGSGAAAATAAATTTARNQLKVEAESPPTKNPKLSFSFTTFTATAVALTITDDDGNGAGPDNDEALVFAAALDESKLIIFTIWNQPIVQYTMPNQPNTCHQSIRSSTAVHYALLGVYNKLLDPPTFSCLFSTSNGIVCVVMSCSVLLADSFTLVKIDNQYPDEWND